MKLVFATGNSGKLREASEILGSGFELSSLAQVGITEDIPETGNTLRQCGRGQRVVRVDKYDEIGLFCMLHARGSCFGNATIGLMYHRYARVFAGILITNRSAIVGRAIVNQHHTEVCKRLCQYRLDALG